MSDDPPWLDEAAEAAVEAYNWRAPLSIPWEKMPDFQRDVARDQVRAILEVVRKHGYGR